MVIVISNISQHIFKILIIILSLSLTNYRVSLKVKNHIFEYVKILGTTIYLFGTSLLSLRIKKNKIGYNLQILG